MVLSLGALAAAGFIGSGLGALLLVHNDPRCYEFTGYSDGRVMWRSIAVPAAGIGGPTSIPPAPEDATSQGTHCTSDIVTPLEALTAVGLLTTGLLALMFIARHNGRTLRQTRGAGAET